MSMDPQHITGRTTLYDWVVENAPDNWNVAEIRGATESLMARALTRMLAFGDDWAAILPTDPAGWLKLLEERSADLCNETNPTEPVSPTGPLADATVEIARRLAADIPCPPNLYLVGVRGDHLHVGRILGGKVTKGEAVTLAAWLVAMADPEMTAFNALLAAILSK